MLNADDAHAEVWRAAAREREGVRVLDFALHASATIRLDGASAPEARPIAFSTPAGDASVRLAAPGRHNAANALAAAAAALSIGVPLDSDRARARGISSGRRSPGCSDGRRLARR